MDEKHSKVGIASFVISVGVAILMLAAFVVAGILNQNHIQRGQKYPGQEIVGLAVIFLLAVDVMAAGLGVASLFQAGTKRLFGILGLVFSGLTLLGSVGLIIIGLMYAAKFAH